ncbi:MAG: phage integrase N-terminal SAM-like domain-containing protein, partial [Syntrophomonadaceae bacterium]
MLLKYAIKDFQEDREFNQVSKATMTNYMGTLKEFHQYCLYHEFIDLAEITPQVVKQYLVYEQKERNNNPTTINSKLRSLKIFFNYLQHAEIITSKANPTQKVNYVHAHVQIEVFSDDQISQMLRYYRRLKTRDKDFFAYRDST